MASLSSWVTYNIKGKLNLQEYMAEKEGSKTVKISDGSKDYTTYR